ncbi:uncharacterized protein LOC117340617 [Pecten maximus]|uniref:uncharacterized protein LOC117340617 n=1 Tax=Pecten maximus TaxID=6579 RepID=UPI001458C5C7|nr:uncharacterized protein LOC117340617 [Pecten maximus]
MLTAEEQQYLESIWSDPKHAGSFSGPYKLYQVVKKDGKFKIGLTRIREFLSGQDAYTLQRHVKRKFKKRRVIVNGLDSQWDGDLMDVSNLSKHNDGIHHILVLQDIFSRFLFTVPLKRKTAEEMVNGLKTVFAKGRQPSLARFDKAFKTVLVQDYLRSINVHVIFTENTATKADYAERRIKDLKSRMFRMLTFNNSYRYIDRLQDITDSINNTPSIPIGGITPAEVNKKTKTKSG